MFATAFHPELTDDLRVHRYFVKMAEEAAKAREDS
jgi:5'-phosphate synthase pdxT subunit